MTNFNRIIAYGCSITSGFELADKEFVPEMSEDEINRIKRKHGIEYWVDFLEKRVSEKDLRSKEAEYAWPKYIASSLNLEYINRAVPGANSQLMIYLLENDIEQGFVKDNDLILVGHTEFSRWFWINDKNQPFSACMGGTLRRWPSKVFYEEFVKHLANEPYFLWQWYRDIKYLDLLAKSLGNRLFQVYCYKTLSQAINDHKYNFKNYQFESVLDHTYSFDSIVDWNNETNLHGFTHPKVCFHRQFANKLLPLICNRLNN
jgi:hypothetical protein